MAQSTAPAPRHQFVGVRDRLAQGEGLPFLAILSRSFVAAACRALGHQWRERVYTPRITLSLFLSQVLSEDHSCDEAVDRFQKVRYDQHENRCRFIFSPRGQRAVAGRVGRARPHRPDPTDPGSAWLEAGARSRVASNRGRIATTVGSKGGRPAAGSVGRGTAADDPDPRPSARRGATAAGPARPRRPDPHRAGIARGTQSGHGASWTDVGGSFGHAGPARGHPLPSRRPPAPPPAPTRPTPPTRPPAARRAGQAGREQKRDCTVVCPGG